ncbi:MAG: xaa-Pro aminopeptidase [Burkholderiales bacterium]|nr:xaa-Pro aminopeptidase [Burkholderiales bacterium]
MSDDTRSLNLEPRLKAILEQEYPRFSDAEYARRHKLLADVMDKAGVDHLLIVTDHRTGNATQWVTAWPGTVEAYTVFKPGVKMTMFMEWFNHFPLGRKIARDVDVQWGEHRGIQKTIEELKRRGARRVGTMGPLAARKYRQLEEHFEVVALDAEYVRCRMIKSEEEIDWLRIGAAFSDAGFAALLAGIRPGLSERELGDLVERAYIKHGGTTMIHYIGVTSMQNPHIYVPPQQPSPRRVQKGDVVFCELSAFWWDYAGQVLRSFTVETDPAPLYRDLHATAEAAFDAVTGVVRHGTTMEEIIEAASVIGRAAERDHEGPQGRRTGRRIDPRHAQRLQTAAQHQTGIFPGGLNAITWPGAGVDGSIVDTDRSKWPPLHDRGAVPLRRLRLPNFARRERLLRRGLS